jgi:hypothetical protein
MKSALAKHFQNVVRCNSYLGPLITSPPQITGFTKAQMKNGRQCAKITDEDGMKDTGKNHDFKIFDTDN